MARAKRIKPEQNMTFSTWSEVDHGLKLIADLENQVQAHTAQADSLIAEAKADMERATTPLTAQINALAKEIEAFATQHREDFGDRKGRELVFGELGWRTHPTKVKGVPTPRAKKFEGWMEKLRQLMPQAIRTQEVPDKEALKDAEPEVLKALKLRLEKKDLFWLKPYHQDAPEV